MRKIVFSVIVFCLLSTSKIVSQSIAVGGIFPTIDHSGSINPKIDYGLYYFGALPMLNFKQPNLSKDANFHLLYLEQALTYKKLIAYLLLQVIYISALMLPQKIM